MDSLRERAGTLFLTAGPLALLALARLVDTVPLVAVALLWLVGALYIVKSGSLHLFGPVLYHELIRLGRGKAIFRTRTFFALILGGIVSVVYYAMTEEYRGLPNESIPLRVQARIGQTLFGTVVILQFLLIALLTPGYVAGAVAEEKERRTLEYLLATDLRSLEILFGKLASRIAGLLVFVLASLPVLGVAQLFGGIDPNLLVVCYSATLVTVAGFSAVSIFASVRARRARDAIALAYMLIVGYHVASWMLILMSAGRGRSLSATFEILGFAVDFGSTIEYFAAGNILWMLARFEMAGGASAAFLFDLLWQYSLFYGIVTALCLGYSALRFRSIALHQLFGGRVVRSWFRKGARLRPASPHPPVGRYPMLWKEVQVGGAGRGFLRGWWGVLAMACLSLAPPAIIYLDHYVFSNSGRYSYDDWPVILRNEMEQSTPTLGVILVCLIFLRVSIRAAGTVLGERDQHTLDELLTTPLSAREIVYSKWLGSLLGVRRLWLLLLFCWTVAACCGSLYWELVPVLFGLSVLYAAGFAWMGMAMTLWARNSMRATSGAVFGAVILGIGFVLLLYGLVVTPLAYAYAWIDANTGYIMDCITLYCPTWNVGELTVSPNRNYSYAFATREPGAFYFHLIAGTLVWIVFSFLMARICIRRFRKVANRDS